MPSNAITYQESKVVTRHEAWCVLCDWTFESSDRDEVRLKRTDHVQHHLELGDLG